MAPTHKPLITMPISQFIQFQIGMKLALVTTELLRLLLYCSTRAP